MVKALHLTVENETQYQAVFEFPSEQPIHLTTSAPIPQGLGKAKNIVYLHIKPPGRIEDGVLDMVCKLTELEVLIIERGISFGILPDSFYDLRNLKKLIIVNTWFSTGEGLNEKIRNFSRLEHLEIRGLYQQKLPEAIGELTRLECLIVRDTNSYLEGGSDIGVPDTIWNLVNLRELRVGPGYSHPPINGAGIENLLQLEVFECWLSVDQIPDAFWEHPGLREVYVNSEQETLRSLKHTQIESLTLRMHYLPLFPELPETLTRLRFDSSAVTEIPSLADTGLESLSLGWNSLTAIPELPASLKNLEISYMRELKILPELPQLTRLRVNSCYKLEKIAEFPESLEVFLIGFCGSLKELPHLPSLKHIWIAQCSELTSLPDSMVVDTLILDFCDNITNLPADIVIQSRLQMTGMKIKKLPDFGEDVQVVDMEDY